MWWVDAPEQLAGATPGTYLARVPAGRVAALHALCAAGMRVVDLGVTLERAGAPGKVPAQVAQGGPQDAGALARIADTAFAHTRFHLDPDVPDAVARAIKRDWVANALAGERGDGVLVVRRDGVAAGFLVVVRQGDDAVIDLVGVAPEHQGGGVGAALVGALVATTPGRVRVGTQAANVGSIRFYERHGFVTVDTVYNLHRHVA